MKYDLLRVFSGDSIDDTLVTLKGEDEVLIMYVSSKK